MHECVCAVVCMYLACMREKEHANNYLLLASWMCNSTAPSAPPSSVMVTGITSTTITVQWRPVPCIHQNGAITGYSVRYGVMGSSMNMTQTVDGASTFESTIENLMSSATYLVEVAAVNSDGTGVYSDPPISQLTRGQSELLHSPPSET